MSMGYEVRVRLIREVSWLTFGQAIRMVASAGVAVVSARVLTVADLGLITYVSATASLFGSIALVGLAPIIRREVAGGEPPSILRKVFVFVTAISGIFCFAGYSAFVFWFGSIDGRSFFVIAIGGISILASPLMMVEIYLQSIGRANVTAMVSAAVAISVSIFKVLMVYCYQDYEWLLILSALEVVLIRLGYFPFVDLRGSVLFERCRLNLGHAYNLVKEGFPLMISGLAILIYMRSDQVMLASILGLESSGVYAVATKFSSMVYFVPTSIGLAVLRRLRRGKEVDRVVLFRYLELSTLFGIIFSGLVCVVSIGLIPVVFGARYDAAVVPSAIYAVTIYFVFVGVAKSQVYLVENLTKYTMISTVTGALVNIVGNLVLIPRFGVSGAAVSTVVSQATSTYIVGLTNAHTRPIFQLQLMALVSVVKKNVFYSRYR